MVPLVRLPAGDDHTGVRSRSAISTLLLFVSCGADDPLIRDQKSEDCSYDADNEGPDECERALAESMDCWMLRSRVGAVYLFAQ